VGAAGHYVKPHGKKPYLKKWEWIVVISVFGALALSAAAYFIVQAVMDDSLPVKGGKVVTDVVNPIVVNEGTAKKPKYYVYGSYDFASLDAEVTVEDVNGDGNETGVYIYPNDKSYDYAFVYGSHVVAQDAAENVHDNIGAMLQNGDVHALKSYTRNGLTGSAYWYTFWEEKKDDNGEAVFDENGNAVDEYQQTFSCYMPTARGCLIVRVTHKGTGESAYVDESVGYEEIGKILDCVQIN
jgi:hypothetical protein